MHTHTPSIILQGPQITPLLLSSQKAGPVSLKSPVLVSRFFTTRASWEAPLVTLRDDKIETELAEASDA